MAVITELIDAGRRLRRAGNLQGAIEHFRQLQATYPDHARIMFELAGAWREFGVPEQALPLYRALLEKPRGEGLPPKDMPRLYTQLGATLLTLQDYDAARAVIDEGVSAHPSYRPLRAWRIFALSRAGAQQAALLDAIELMLESLAPSRWDIFEDDIKAIARRMRAELDGTEAAPTAAAAPAKPKTTRVKKPRAKATPPSPKAKQTQAAEIAVADAESEDDGREVEVQVKQPARKAKRRSRRKSTPAQLGKKAVKIDIGSAADEPAADDAAPAADANFKIPIDDD